MKSTKKAPVTGSHGKGDTRGAGSHAPKDMPGNYKNGGGAHAHGLKTSGKMPATPSPTKRTKAKP